MRPIEQKTEVTLVQAVKCAGFRLPLQAKLRQEPLELAIALRYGLIGIAAAHQALLSCPDAEERALIRQLHGFGRILEEQIFDKVLHRLPFQPSRSLHNLTARVFNELLGNYLPLYHRLCPLDLCLSVISDEFLEKYRHEIVSGSPFFGRRAAKRAFHATTDESYGFALRFFERRHVGIEEVAEIALLGE